MIVPYDKPHLYAAWRCRLARATGGAVAAYCFRAGVGYCIRAGCRRQVHGGKRRNHLCSRSLGWRLFDISAFALL